MVRLVPDSESLREFNACHAPDDGKFCSEPAATSGAFQAWFRRSKVVDDAGRPLRVYHGTAENLDTFEARDGFIWFTPDPRTAGDYATRAAFRKQQDEQDDTPFDEDILDVDETPAGIMHQQTGNKGQSIYPAYLRMEKPLDLSELGHSPETFDVFQFLKQKGFADPDANFDDWHNDLTVDNPTLWKMIEDWGLARDIRKKGYDGIIIEDIAADGNGHVAYAVFSPKQVKSAIGNKGTWSRRSKKIAEANTCHDPDDGRFCSGTGVVKLWRGVRGTGFDPRTPRDGYIVTYSTSKAVADTYTQADAEPFSLDLSQVKLIEFPTQKRHGYVEMDKFEFDRRAQALKPGEVLVARGVYDSGPHASTAKDPARRWSYPSDVYAMRTPRGVTKGHDLTEFNPCHSPNDGRFCQTEGPADSGGSGGTTSAFDPEQSVRERLEYNDGHSAAAIFKAYGVEATEHDLKSLGKVYVFKDGKQRDDGWGRPKPQYWVLTGDDASKSYFVEKAEDFINGIQDAHLDELYPDEDFWEHPGPLYHATPDENVESILQHGIEARHESRSLSNRWINAAVFTRPDPEELAGGEYGNNIFEIDTAAMKRDGYMPHVEREDSTTYREKRAALAHVFGLDDWYEDDNSWEGIGDTDHIIHGRIPAKYLKLVGN